jgi:zona occludens toxin
MAINCYCGLQGSGKSYEVVSSVILDAVSHGRRVVTNVAGIDEERIHEYLVLHRDCDAELLGRIVHIENDRITQPQFFPDEEKPHLPAIVEGGDLVAVDEAWRFWGTDNGKLSAEHMQFFRMHRHYVHPATAVACDVVLMTQDVTGLHRAVKNVIEFTFRMQKHKALGLTKCYRVDIHEGWKLNGKTRIDHRQKKYDSEIFPLYQSYAGGEGRESAIDRRQNILANRTLWLYLGAAALLLPAMGVIAFKFFHPHPAKDPRSASTAPSAKPAVQAALLPASPQVALPQYSGSWHVSGAFEGPSGRWIVLSNDAGRIRLESPSLFSGGAGAAIGLVDGERVARWTGAPAGSPAKSLLGAAK